MGNTRNACGISIDKHEVKRPSAKASVDMSIILKWILEKQRVRTSTGFI
jgi:hypothetical protein